MNLYLFEIRFISGHKCLFGWNFNGHCFDIFYHLGRPLLLPLLFLTQWLSSGIKEFVQSSRKVTRLVI
ncbi:hypothetical protein Hanom_Chr05g00411001 [Helianthus anomalus]